MSLRLSSSLVALSFSLPLTASAAPAAEGSASVGTDGVATTSEVAPPDTGKRKPKNKRKDVPWIKRWAPERNMAELGIYGGILVPSRSLELFQADLDLPNQGFKQFKRIAPDVGARIGYYPIRFFGLELEGGAMPTRTTADQAATLWAVRGHLVAQLGLSSITPFLLIGPTALGVSSARLAVGKEVDAGIHFGGGFKVFLSRHAMIRLDVRDTVTAKRGVKDGVTSNLEVLLGLSLTLGRKDKPKPPPKDTDGDGFYDNVDKCVTEPGVAPDGCPIRDKDGDGFLDNVDKCIDEPGVAPDGCPIRDKDGDGFLDDVDQCIDEPGVAPDGCPIRDTDGDGILDDVDQCKEEPETKNGYEDGDGCPDEVPKEVEKFTGVIEGIFFDVDKDTIRAKSKPKLDEAVGVLKKFESVRVEISGHTDSSGKREHNVDLSQRRAEAVKKYLVDAGIDAGRITTRGAGPDEPRADNKTKAGKAQNRRIEFKLVTQ
ncbi:MAG: OmpA family protein [Deltaproteobacteria bacterium]|nr:OmpA family protein [Deltaproteobacteria bacterium]